MWYSIKIMILGILLFTIPQLRGFASSTKDQTLEERSLENKVNDLGTRLTVLELRFDQAVIEKERADKSERVAHEELMAWVRPLSGTLFAALLGVAFQIITSYRRNKNLKGTIKQAIDESKGNET